MLLFQAPFGGKRTGNFGDDGGGAGGGQSGGGGEDNGGGGGDGGGGTPITPGDWSATDLRALPNVGRTWKLLAEDDYGGVTAAVIDANRNFNKEGSRPYQRLRQTEFDGKPCYEHRVEMSDIVVPFGWDWPNDGTKHRSLDPISFVNGNAKYILLRWHFAATAYRGIKKGGKFIILCGGRGYIGDNDPPPYSSSEFGSEGWGFNSMSPGTSSKKTYLGGMASHQQQNKPEGETFNSGDSNATFYPLNRWNVIDQLVDISSGPTSAGQYSLYLNGQRVARSAQAKFVNNLDNCKVLWVRHRHMHGGNPQGADYLPVQPYREYCGGFSIWYAD